MIGGNTVLELQIKDFDEAEINLLGEQGTGEQSPVWRDYMSLTGWLDLSTGNSTYNNYNAKVAESSHIFICDYQKVDKKEKDLRAVFDGAVYDVVFIDNPMNLNQHLEIYLNKVE